MKNYQIELENYINNISVKQKLALHSCCGPCSSYVLEYLKNHFEVTVFFYNPNIHPQAEYHLRLSEQKKLCEIYDIELVECDYNPDDFLAAVQGYENEPEGGMRCTECFELRLKNTVKIAKNLGFDLITTTLTVSPHKNAMLINEIGQSAAKEQGLQWLPSDFKKCGGYLRSIEICRQYGIYRQDYCGCKFSMR